MTALTHKGPTLTDDPQRINALVKERESEYARFAAAKEKAAQQRKALAGARRQAKQAAMEREFAEAIAAHRDGVRELQEGTHLARLFNFEKSLLLPFLPALKGLHDGQA